MIFLKVAVTIFVVTGLSIVAERVSPRAAGILAGYPAGSAIALFFIGVELGPAFAGASALYNVLGLTAMLVFLYVYFRVSNTARAFTILAASMAAVLIFLAGISLLNSLHLPGWSGLLITGAAIPISQRMFRRIQNSQITRRVHLGPRVLLFRATLSALIILTVTGAAHLVEPGLAGLFTAFPATIFPLILIVHSTYGTQQAHTIIKNVPTGLWALVFYSITVSFVYPAFGVYWGTLLSFGVATVYLMALTIFFRRN
jgi:hypothetical protein